MNLRRRTPTDLQSVPFDLSGTSPEKLQLLCVFARRMQKEFAIKTKDTFPDTPSSDRVGKPYPFLGIALGVTYVLKVLDREAMGLPAVATHSIPGAGEGT